MLSALTTASANSLARSSAEDGSTETNASARKRAGPKTGPCAVPSCRRDAALHADRQLVQEFTSSGVLSKTLSPVTPLSTPEAQSLKMPPPVPVPAALSCTEESPLRVAAPVL